MRNSCFPYHHQYNAFVNVSQYPIAKSQQYISIVSSEYMKELPIAHLSPCSPRSGQITAKPFTIGVSRSILPIGKGGRAAAEEGEADEAGGAPRIAVGSFLQGLPGRRSAAIGSRQGNGVRRAPRVSGGVPRRRQSRRHGKPGAVPQPSPPLAGRRAKRAGEK